MCIYKQVNISCFSRRNLILYPILWLAFFPPNVDISPCLSSFSFFTEGRVYTHAHNIWDVYTYICTHTYFLAHFVLNYILLHDLNHSSIKRQIFLIFCCQKLCSSEHHLKYKRKKDVGGFLKISFPVLKFSSGFN